MYRPHGDRAVAAGQVGEGVGQVGHERLALVESSTPLAFS
jgi:hypothetical protein